MSMNNDVVIEVKDLHKKFKIYFDKSHSLKDSLVSKNRRKYQEREVIRGVSFNVKKGEAIGLVGHNGCGKSTTLKMLTRIMYPDSGSIEIKGRVSSLLELGAGFHPDLSGRENIYINASIFGLTKKEIDSKIDEIIAFSELEEFIDNPVRTYSSGMYMRLAFSVAINVNAEVLLIDEILGVGDVNFQTKCFNKLMEIKGSGTTIVLVSHSTAQIERICDRSIWIHEGKVKLEGNPIDVHREYLNYMFNLKAAEVEGRAFREEEVEEIPEGLTEDVDDGEKVSIRNAYIVDRNGKPIKVFHSGDYVEAKFSLYAKELISNYHIEINLVRADGVFCFGFSTLGENVVCEPWKGLKEFSVAYPKMNMLSGKYHLDIHVADVTGTTIFFGGNAVVFDIHPAEYERGIVYLDHQWIEG